MGKTHLAVGLSLQALDVRKVVYYTTLFSLISDLKGVQLPGWLECRWRVYLCSDLLVINEVGYIGEPPGGERVVSEHYELGSIIFHSNKYFSDWGERLSDDILSTALLDQLLRHAHVANIWGRTYRCRTASRLASNRSPRSKFQWTGNQLAYL